MSGRMKLVLSALVALLVIGLGAALIWRAGRTGDEAFADCGQTRVAGAADIGGPFTLVDEDGRTVTEADVLAKPSLVYFGYTFCPDVCPLDAARNVEAVELLAEQGFDVQPVFITVDPARDTAEVLKEWTDYLHPDMLGLTGSPEQIAAVARAYRVYYKAQPAEDDYYLVDHTAFTYLMLPEYGMAEFFRRDATAEDMAATTACYLKAAT